MQFFEYIWFPDPGDIKDVPCTVSSMLMPDLICAWYTLLLHMWLWGPSHGCLITVSGVKETQVPKLRHQTRMV
jgi:hypothetical protein